MTLTPTPFLGTVANLDWLLEHWDDLYSTLPKEAVRLSEEALVPLGYKLKVLGIDWRDIHEFAAYIVVLEKAGLIIRQGNLMIGNPTRPHILDKDAIVYPQSTLLQ